MNKSDIRKSYLAKRREMSNDDVLAKSKLIQDKIFNSNWYKNSNVIMIYVSFGNEVETHTIIADALKCDKKVVVPVCVEGNNLIPVEIQSLGDMKPNKYGILEPETVVKYDGDIDVVIVPGVAFDREFNRVGFGAGYYDRFLSGYIGALKVGICFNSQICDNIDADDNDITMDIIISEEEIMKNND